MSQFRHSIIGCQAPKFVEFLVRSIPEIEVINVFRPPVSQPIQEDPLISDQEQALISRSLALRQDLNLPFWDALFLNLSIHPMAAENVVKRASLHNPQDVDCLPLYRDDCSETRLLKLIEALPQGRILAISSRVSTKQADRMHLPMLDFHCQASAEHDRLVRAVMMEIGLSGYIARSGRSYHFYGRSLVDEQSLITILGRSLLYCPIIDRAWIAHQLLERACGLRISPGKEYQDCPEIVYEV